MAESYVTKFTKYVKDCNDNLYNILKDKKIQVLPNDTLSVLVDKVNNIDTVYPTYPQYYERDPGLPNIDELFDNDPLRKVNGGDYPYCAYWICLLDQNGKVGIYNYYYTNTDADADEKIIISDGKTYENKTSTIKEAYEVQSNGIYTDSDGLKYCLVKYYRKTVYTGNYNYKSATNIVEGIDDRYKTISYGILSVTSSDSSSVTYRNPELKYARYELSNVTDTTHTSANTSTMYLSGKTIVINGKCNNTSFNMGRAEKILFNGVITYSGATTLTIKITSSYYTPTYIQLPYGNTTTFGVELTGDFDVVKTNNTITSLNFVNGKYGSYDVFYTSDAVKSIYFGKNIQSIINSPRYIEDIDLMDDAFGVNTSAITLDFYYAYLNKENVLKLFNKLADRTGKTANILKLSTYSKSLVTDEEKAILTNKNWTIS